MMTIFITINYEEGITPEEKPDMGYEGIELQYNKDKKIFFTGNFVKDWYEVRKFIAMELAKEDNPMSISYSSSVDHFIMDGAPFESGYLHIIDNVPIFKYFNKTDPHWYINQRDVDEQGVEFFVPKGMQPTWEELKEMCK